MRISLIATGFSLLLLSGCGGAQTDPPPESKAAPSESATPTTNADSSTSSNAAAQDVSVARGEEYWPDPLTSPRGESPAPDIDPDAAPDVAFGYSYSFGLPVDQVAPIQQRHARLCEELGRERCQVTGMSYRRSDGNDARAELKLALEPGLAHRFGERALDSVREAEGTLVDSQVTGTDVGSGIRSTSRTIEEAEEQLAELEQRIAASGTLTQRQSLQREADSLRLRIRALRSSRGDARERLATTPVTLTYASGAYVTGNPDFGAAAGTAWSQMKWLAYGLFTLLMLLGPWAAVVALIWFGLRTRRRRTAAPEVASAS
jgi:hypothetical protein